MKKEIWGVNVIGRQGVNAENDFAIMANDAGDDVIVKIKDAELTGAEFETLKEIAEGGPTPGGGGFPEQDLNDPTFVPEANHYYQQKSGEQPAPVMTALYVGQEFRDGDKLHFDTTKTQELHNFLANLTHDDPAYSSDGIYNLAAKGVAMVLEGAKYDTTGNVLMAPGGDMDIVPIYATEAGSFEGLEWSQGWQNLDDNGDFVIVIPETAHVDKITINEINDGEIWNGTIIGTLEEAPASQFTDGVLYFYDGEEYHAITGEGGEGGGMPDPADAEDGDVIKVTVTPAEYEADPKVAVGDVLTDLYALNSVVPDLSQLSYDDHRFEQSMGSVIADLMRGTYTVTKHGESQELTFTIAAVNVMGMSAILMLAGETPEQERPNDVVFYMAGNPESPDGWVTGAPLQDGYANLMVMSFDEHPHLPELTITELANQDVWCKWIGKQKPFKKIKDEIKESGWGKPYPAFTKANQVLTSAGESYMLMPTNKDIPLSGSGRFYFNTNLSIDQMDENLGMMLRDGMSGMEFRIFNTKDESEYSLAIGGKKDEHDEYAVRYIAYSKDPGNGDDPTFSWVYATADYDIDAEGTTLHMTHGWNQEEINNCTWDGDSHTYVDAIQSDYAMILPIYGSMFTIQEGLYYGDVKNAHVEWKDLNINLESMTVDSNKMRQWSGDSLQQPVVVVYDNQGQDDKLHYMTMYNLKKEIVQLYKHRIKFAFTDNNNNAFKVRLTLINNDSHRVTINTLDGYIASGVVSVNGVIYPDQQKEYETIVDMDRTGAGGFSVTAASIQSTSLKFYNNLSFDGVTVSSLEDNVTALYPNLG